MKGTTMTYEEMRALTAKLAKELGEAGVMRPEAQIWIRANARTTVYLDGHDFQSKFFNGETVEECAAQAEKFISEIPDPQVLVLQNYAKKLADAIDYGHENNVPDKLVDPVRRAQKATSDMMLLAPK